MTHIEQEVLPGVEESRATPAIESPVRKVTDQPYSCEAYISRSAAKSSWTALI